MGSSGRTKAYRVKPFILRPVSNQPLGLPILESRDQVYTWNGSPSLAFVVVSCSCATLFSLCVFSRYLIKTMYQRLSSIFGIYVNPYICQYKRAYRKNLNRSLQSGGKWLKLVEHISLVENLQVTFE